jgi:hypothetical protein
VQQRKEQRTEKASYTLMQAEDCEGRAQTLSKLYEKGCRTKEDVGRVGQIDVESRSYFHPSIMSLKVPKANNIQIFKDGYKVG